LCLDDRRHVVPDAVEDRLVDAVGLGAVDVFYVGVAGGSEREASYECRFERLHGVPHSSTPCSKSDSTSRTYCSICDAAPIFVSAISTCRCASSMVRWSGVGAASASARACLASVSTCLR